MHSQTNRRVGNGNTILSEHATHTQTRKRSRRATRWPGGLPSEHTTLPAQCLCDMSCNVWVMRVLRPASAAAYLTSQISVRCIAPYLPLSSLAFFIHRSRKRAAARDLRDL